MSYVNFNRALSRAQIEALTNATNGKIYFATDGGIYVGNASGTAELKASSIKDWQENNSESASYIQNRTHYDTSVESALETSFASYLNQYGHSNSVLSGARIKVLSPTGNTNIIYTSEYEFGSSTITGTSISGISGNVTYLVVQGRNTYDLSISISKSPLSSSSYVVDHVYVKKNLGSQVDILGNNSCILTSPVKLDNKYLNLEDSVVSGNNNLVTSDAVYKALQSNPSVFWALYNTTTFNEIKQAILDGKTVYAARNQNVIDDWSQGLYVEDNVYTLSDVYEENDGSSGDISFMYSTISNIYRISVNMEDNWYEYSRAVGNVSGPSSSTNDRIALFSGTTGRSIKQSTHTIDSLITLVESNIRRYTNHKLCSDSCRYYKIFFTSADGTKWVPASADTSNSSTSAKVVNQRPIDPFGEIIFVNSTSAINANVNIRNVTTEIYSQYTINGFFIGYSFNRTGAASALDTSKPVYVKCTPQADGSAIIDPDTPITQTLPTSADGKIYIYLGEPSGATSIYLPAHHPVYYYEDGAVRLWTNPNDNVFIATYGTTTFAEITDAINAGKHVVVKKGNARYNLYGILNNSYIFYSALGSSITQASCNSSSVWSASVTYFNTFERNANKVTSLSSSSTDTQYPSAKAVYDYVGQYITGTVATQAEIDALFTDSGGSSI